VSPWSESDTWGVPLDMEWSEYDQEHVPIQNLLWAPHPPEDAHETAFIGGRGSPILLYRQHRAGKLTKQQLRRRVGLAWRTCGQPSTELSDDQWAELFGSAGLTVNGWPAPVNAMETMVLYRTATPEHIRGRAWGNKIEPITSTRYHRQVLNPHQPLGTYRVDAPPESMLCIIAWPRWTEYVIDTTGLVIEKLDDPIELPQKGTTR
jgi:hypothetical protein